MAAVSIGYDAAAETDENDARPWSIEGKGEGGGVGGSGHLGRDIFKNRDLPLASAAEKTSIEEATNSRGAKLLMTAPLFPSEFTPILRRRSVRPSLLLFLTCRCGMKTQLLGLL